MRLRMARLQIVGLKTRLRAAVRALHELGCVQIDEAAEAGGLPLRPMRPSPETVKAQEELAYLLARIEGLQAALGPAPQAAPAACCPPGGDCVPDARAALETLGPQAQALAERRAALEAEQASLPRYQATLRKLLPITPASAADPANISVGVLAARSHLAALDLVAQGVLELTGGRAEMATADVDGTTQAMLIVAPRECAPELEALLGRENISRLRLPAGLGDQPPDRAAHALQQRLAAIPGELAEAQAALAALAETWAPQLACWAACLRDRLDEFHVLSRLGETEQTFVLSGWTPESEVGRVRAALAEAAGEEVAVQVLPLTHADARRAPVALANPGPARPFQTLVGLLSLPRYDGLDPTALMAFFLPVFFGMILGDVGYGALLLLLSLYLLRRIRKPGMARDIVQVIAYGSGWAILFGFLYGEAFGDLGEHYGLRALWFDRASPAHVTSLLVFTVALGAAHVTLGLLLGVWEAARERSRNHLLERGGMLIGLIGLFSIVAVLLRWLPAGFMTPAVAALLVGIGVLGASLGWLGLLLGPIEFIGVVGNILSYLRIAAIGLASVYLARVANDLAGSLGSLLVGLIAAVLIHALNLALGAFSPTIHSLRLHYVEFFRKFYEGGGRKFEPFRTGAEG